MNKLAAFLISLPLVGVFGALFYVLAMALLGFAEFKGWGSTESTALVGLGTLMYMFMVGGIAYHTIRHNFENTTTTLLSVVFLGVGLYLPLLGGLFFAAIFRHTPGQNPGPLWAIIGTIGTFFLMAGIATVLNSGTSRDKPIRGRTLTKLEEVIERAKALIQGQTPDATWGGFELPAAATETNFCVVGTTGSGKSVTLQLLMDSVLRRVRPGSDFRAVLYDAKRDLRSVLDGMKIPADRIKLFNPFDARSVAWDMAKDIQSPATAEQIATTLIPVEEGPNRFFSDAARHLLRGVINAYILTVPGRWTFRDVILTMESEKNIRALLSRHPATRPLIDQYFGEEKTFQNINSTIATYMAGYATVAALWSHAAERLSLTEWLAAGKEAILVLGNDDSLRAPLDAINRVLFQRMSELLLAQTESKTRRTWVVVDELKEAGRLDGLPRLLTKGRSYGVRVVIGFQDIDGLESLYGPSVPHEILGMCANKSILRIDSHRTAKWAADAIGKAEVRQYTKSTSYGPGGTSQSTNESIVQREAVLADELMNLPLPDDKGFTGYHIVPALGVYHAQIEFPPKFRELAKEPDFVPRPVEQQYLLPAGTDDGSCLAAAVPIAEPPPAADIDEVRRITRERQ